MRLDETRWQDRPLPQRAKEALMRPLKRNF